MDVKSAFLNGYINEEVYVKQPLDFEYIKNPSSVYKLRKTLYALKKAPMAWYNRLRNFICERGFEKCKVDITLFINKIKDHTLLVQMYIDDIIFGSTNNDLCKEFSIMMKREFKMSMMDKMDFFYFKLSN